MPTAEELFAEEAIREAYRRDDAEHFPAVTPGTASGRWIQPGSILHHVHMEGAFVCVRTGGGPPVVQREFTVDHPAEWLLVGMVNVPEGIFKAVVGKSGVYAYLGTRACGCAALVAVDEPKVVPDMMAELALEILEILRAGGRIERLPLEEVRTQAGSLPWKCEACQAEEPTPSAAESAPPTPPPHPSR